MKLDKARILFVDDDKATRRMMMMLAEDVGFAVTTAGTVAEALELAEKTPF